MVLDPETALSSHPLGDWPFQFFISMCSVLTMVSVLSFCAAAHCCRRKPNKDEVDEPYGIINAGETATADACAPVVSFRNADHSVRNKTDRFSQPTASQPGVHGQHVAQRSSVPISQPPSSTRRALPKLPAVAPTSEATTPGTIYSSIERNISTKRRSPSLPYIEEPANPTYESIDAESDSISDPLYSKLESESQSTRKYDYPIFSGRSRPNAATEEAVYQSASQIYAGGSEDPYSSITSQVGGEAGSDRGYAKVKDHIEKGLENQPGPSGTQLPSSSDDFDHLYTKIRRGPVPKKQAELAPSTSIPPLPPPLPQPESKLPDSSAGGNASREPSYRYITVRESVDVIRQRINERESVARREAQNAGSFTDDNDVPVREHYYSSIGAGSDNDSASGTALYEPISDVPDPQGQGNVQAGRSILQSSFSGYRNAYAPVVEPLTIGVEDAHDLSSPPRPPTSPIPNRLHYTSDSLGTSFSSSKVKREKEGSVAYPQNPGHSSASVGTPSIVKPVSRSPSNTADQKPAGADVSIEQKKQLRKNFFGSMLNEAPGSSRVDYITHSYKEPSNTSSSSSSGRQTVIEGGRHCESLPSVPPAEQSVSRFPPAEDASSASKNPEPNALSSGPSKGQHTVFPEAARPAVSSGASGYGSITGHPSIDRRISSEDKEEFNSSKVTTQNNFVSQVYTEDFNGNEKRQASSSLDPARGDVAGNNFLPSRARERCRSEEEDHKQLTSAVRGETDSREADINTNKDTIPSSNVQKNRGLDSGRADTVSDSLSAPYQSRDRSLSEEDSRCGRESFDGDELNSDARKQKEIPAASQTNHSVKTFKRRITEEKECIVSSEEISYESSGASEEQDRAEVERIVPIQKVPSRFPPFVPTVNMSDVYKSPPGPSSPKMNRREFEISVPQTSFYQSKAPMSSTVGVGTEMDGNVMERSTDSTGSQTERTFGFDGWTGRSSVRSNIPVLRDGVEVRQRSEEARKRRRHQGSVEREVAPDVEEIPPETDQKDISRSKKRGAPPPELGQLTGNDYISPVDLSTERSWPLVHSLPQSSSSYTVDSRSTGQSASPSQRMPPNVEAIFQPTSFKQPNAVIRPPNFLVYQHSDSLDSAGDEGGASCEDGKCFCHCGGKEPIIANVLKSNLAEMEKIQWGEPLHDPDE